MVQIIINNCIENDKGILSSSLPVVLSLPFSLSSHKNFFPREQYFFTSCYLLLTTTNLTEIITMKCTSIRFIFKIQSI